MDKFNNKYRIPSAHTVGTGRDLSYIKKDRKRNRMIDFDYSSDNLYFVTSCTKDKICWFGDVHDGRMVLNEVGKIAEQQWQWLINKHLYLRSHAFVVMPNHIHGILEINGDLINNDGALEWNGQVATYPYERSQKIKSLSELIGAYKTTTSKKIHLLKHYDFEWQRSFHDHIIRNTISYNKIYEYILTNEQNWVNDMFNE